MARSRTTNWITAGFAYIYFAWGATYLGVHAALESAPPFLIAGCRFLIAGLVLFVLLRVFHRSAFVWGDLKEWKDAAIVGTLIPVTGNGLVAWAQVSVPSGLAALLFGSMPLWIIFFDWVRPAGTAPSLRTSIGLALGLVGVFILVGPVGPGRDGSSVFFGELALLLAACSWAAGGIYSRHVQAKGSSLLPMARQMIVGGVILLFVSVAMGDWRRFALSDVTATSWIGFVYLVVFGSLIGFTVYVWLLRVSTAERVATISYMNLLVAVVLGWVVLKEPMTPRLILGGMVILSAVALVLKKSKIPQEIAVD